LVLGAGGAIGGACLAALAAAGNDAMGADLTGAAEPCDVTDPAAREALAARLGPVDGVIYAPGLVMTAEVTAADWAAYRRVMAVNLDGAFHAAAAFARPMIAAGRPGAFVFLSSMAGLRGEAEASAYRASKFGVIGLAQALAAEWAPHGLRANAVCPGNVDSPMLRRVAADIAAADGGDAAAIYDGFARAGAARRLVTPGEVAAACLWLSSDAAAGVTGTALQVDAGAMVG
jgi:NAD(P)-dependent dehydrogenase (short-subunit alcohol dehydrogenase family)